jgi:predicted NAD/FAD-binding protein
MFWGKKVKIAVIGSGISGLTSANVLSSEHEVHLFESENRLGGHTHTHDIEVASGKYLVDTGFIVHNDRNYPNFLKLMTKLQVETKDSFMSFSVKVEENGLEYNGTSINSLFCQRKNIFNPSFYRMIKDILRFNKEATSYYLTHKEQAPDTMSLEDYLLQNNYSSEFIEYDIMPMGAAIWSASRDEMKRFPLHFFVRFFHHHGMLTVDNRPQWRVLKGGSKSYIPKITAPFVERIHLGHPIKSVTRSGEKVILNDSLEFDHVVFACHANQAIKILKDPSEKESKVMGGFAYRPNDILLHTDTSILPKSKLGHASWNYYLPRVQQDRVAVTYHMNILQGIKSPETFLVSLNMDHLIDPKKVLKKIPYSHPVYNQAAIDSQKQWDQVSTITSRTHFCGAYWGNGFHEDGVKSALQVTQAFGLGL